MGAEREGERERERTHTSPSATSSDEQFGHRSIICSTCEGGMHVLMD